MTYLSLEIQRPGFFSLIKPERRQWIYSCIPILSPPMTAQAEDRPSAKANRRWLSILRQLRRGYRPLKCSITALEVLPEELPLGSIVGKYEAGVSLEAKVT